MGRPNIEITDAAARQLADVIASQNKNAAIRIYVAGGG